MKPFVFMPVWLCMCALLAGCGPREIGQSEIEPPGPLQATAVEQMRAPLTGVNNTQRILYYMNQPDVMESNQRWNLRQQRRAMGLAPEEPGDPPPPARKSPFRQ